MITIKNDSNNNNKNKNNNNNNSNNNNDDVYACQTYIFKPCQIQNLQISNFDYIQAMVITAIVSITYGLVIKTIICVLQK